MCAPATPMITPAPGSMPQHQSPSPSPPRTTRAGAPAAGGAAGFGNWRRIRDWEGAEGWVYHSLLTGKRTALVAPQPKKTDDLLELRDKPDAASPVMAKMQHGVLATVKRCKDGWCRLIGEGFDGWIEQPRLWGVYPNAKLDYGKPIACRLWVFVGG